MMAWNLVLDPKGVVLAALGGAPLHWVDARLVDRHDVPDELRAAAHVLTNQITATGQRAAARSLTLEATAQDVNLVVIDVVPVRRTLTDLRALLDTSLAIVHRQAKAVDVSLDVTVAENVPLLVSLDSEKIAWVAVALAGNALRYVRTGSRLRPGGSIAVRVMVDRAAADIVIDVHDDGPGIPPQTVARLFRRNEHAHRTGLGLALVSDILVAHGGSVEILSSTDSVDHGTTIRLRLPALASSADRLGWTRSSTPPPRPPAESRPTPWLTRLTRKRGQSPRPRR